MKSDPSKKRVAKAKPVQSTENDDGGVVREKFRLQRKETKRIRFLTKVKDGQRTLSASKTLQKKKRKRTREKAAKVFDSLASLADSLPSKEDIAKSSGVLKRVPRKNSHQQAVVKETKQLASVLAHPQFQSNPFLAIQKHLINTLPAAELPPQKKDQEKKKKTKSTKKGPSVEHMVE